MFGIWKRMKHIENTVRMLKNMEKQNIQDDYSCGLYNGIELCMAVIEDREPEFATYENEPIVIDHDERIERTVASGIIRRSDNP